MKERSFIGIASILVTIVLIIFSSTSVRADTSSSSSVRGTNVEFTSSGMPGTPPGGFGTGKMQPPPGGFGGGQGSSSSILPQWLENFIHSVLSFLGLGNSSSSQEMSGSAKAPPGSGNSNADVSIVASTSGYSLSGATDSKSDVSFTSTNADESAGVVSGGGNLQLKNITVTKSGDVSNTENSEFYGLNSGIIAKDKSTLSLTGGTITTTSKGANAVFSTSNSTVNISGVTIKTTAESGARGLDATYGGTINADNITVSTVGAHSAALATDRGEGNINVTNSTVETSGTDSPAIYATGKFVLKNITGTANGAEAAVIEGQNSIMLTDSHLTGNKNWGVMIYQSFSGDAKGTGGVFTMKGGSLTATQGPLFYSTNTTGYISLTNVTLKATSGVLVKAEANSRWGTSGSNGSTLSLTTDTQKLEGNIEADSISSLSLKLQNNSTLKGMIDTTNTAKEINLSLDNTSQWNLTGDSHINTLTGITLNGNSVSNIIGNGFNVYYSKDTNSELGGKTYSLQNGGNLIAE